MSDYQLGLHGKQGTTLIINIEEFPFIFSHESFIHPEAIKDTFVVEYVLQGYSSQTSFSGYMTIGEINYIQIILEEFQAGKHDTADLVFNTINNESELKNTLQIQLNKVTEGYLCCVKLLSEEENYPEEFKQEITAEFSIEQGDLVPIIEQLIELTKFLKK